MRAYQRILTIMVIAPMLGAAGCQQQFRYPCQDPENWGKPECQRPICEVNRDCPDLIFKENKRIELPATPLAPAPRPKGEC